MSIDYKSTICRPKSACLLNPYTCNLNLLLKLLAATFCVLIIILYVQTPVYCIQGDSAFGFSGMELETAYRYVHALYM